MKIGKLIEITTDELEEIFLSIDCPEKMKIALIHFTSFTKLVKFVERAIMMSLPWLRKNLMNLMLKRSTI